MRTATIQLSLDVDVLAQIDRLVSEKRFVDRNTAIQSVLRERFNPVRQGRLARECAKLDQVFERQLAEELL